ncbi:hypothetical protein, partial [Escherichia coli]|uniref:hypothetical protein n=1 Tax=Escherichia coli TaxID=562 RepID=UPI0020230B5F
LLTQRAARERLPLGEGLPCLLLDAEHEWAGYPESDPQSAVGVDNLAYVIYKTSRSPEDFLRLLCRERVTVLNQTPSAFKQLMQVACAGQEVPPLALRHVV